MDAENLYLLPVELFKQIKIRKNYPTESAAVDCALEAARKWIDEGKPELFPENVMATRSCDDTRPFHGGP